MTTYYVIFNEDNTVTTSINKDFDPEKFTHIKSRVSDVGDLEYYAHNSIAESYKELLVNRVLL